MNKKQNVHKGWRRYASRVWFVIAFCSLLITVVAGGIMFYLQKDFEETTATIVGFKEVPTKGGETTIHTQLSYEVDGRTYVEYIDFPYSESRRGEVIEIRYDPDHPTQVEGVEESLVLLGIFAFLTVASFVIGLVLHVISRWTDRRKTANDPPQRHHGPFITD